MATPGKRTVGTINSRSILRMRSLPQQGEKLLSLHLPESSQTPTWQPASSPASPRCTQSVSAPHRREESAGKSLSPRLNRRGGCCRSPRGCHRRAWHSDERCDHGGARQQKSPPCSPRRERPRNADIHKNSQLSTHEEKQPTKDHCGQCLRHKQVSRTRCVVPATPTTANSSEKKNRQCWQPSDELLGGAAALNDLRQTVIEKQGRRLRELSAYYQKCHHLSEENNYLKCREQALVRQLKEAEETSRMDRNEELQKLTALNAHLLHDNMVLHTSLALLIDRQPTIVTGLYETDMICWVVPNLALLAREGKLPRRIVSPWLKSENRRTCRLQFILYPFGTKHDHREALAGKPDSRLATPRKACPALLVRMKRNVEATFYLFFGKQCTSPVTYQFSESVGGGRSFYRHDFSSTWLDDLGYPGQDTFHVGLSLLHCSDRSQYVIRHHDRHYADLQPRCLRLS